MKFYEFNYNKKFLCIANNCKHNCCIGWKIDIDKKTLKKYFNLQKLDNKFNQNAFDKNSFKLSNLGRCPFLEKNNLCYVIKKYGEKHLCSTCKTHPRFKNFFSDRVETGLGLYCEESARIILLQKGKMKLKFVRQTPSKKSLLPFEKQVLTFRKEVLSIVQNRTLSTSDKIQLLEKKSSINLNEVSYLNWVNIYNNLEKLSVNDFTFNKLNCFLDFTVYNNSFDREYEQILAYLTYRHISRAIDNLDLNVRLSFVLLSFKFIIQIFALINKQENKCNIENLIEACRIYSSEIECSDQNIISLLNTIESLIKFI